VEDSFFSIMIDGGIPLMSFGNSSMKELLNGRINIFQMRAAPSGITRMDYSGYLILYAQSPERQWNFIYIEPYSTIEKDWFGRFIISAIAATAFVLLVSILGSFFFSRRIFIPIKAIFEKANTNKENPQKLKETDLILRKIDELIEYNSRVVQEKIDLEKSDSPYPVSIENEIYRAFRDANVNKFERAAESFRSYFIERQVKLENVQGAYLRLFCASQVFIQGNFSKASGIPDYRLIFSLNTIDEIHAWIIEWFTQVFYILHTHKRTQSRLIHDICRFIDANLDKDITAKGLWQRFNYHPSSLHKLFREELHLTLKKYVDSKRIEKAKDLLLTTNLKINEIAVQVGYSHTQSFIAFFHHIVHCTPVEFRQWNSRSICWTCRNCGLKSDGK
jgi:AraC-like DNA-binding protein